ncbi:molybdate ABC transporter substrate-binding protein [Chelativorans sp. YIM 93263]|uniref:molybdate ABC transporter substrate-binding protein n=1 Tax=Chelativorans sp. YIM 93263 TaxID=2906648 RepID=UPI0023784CD2|nr:molybdate ABC transporter substrate-binding protein [Chelativorans sp. YIM 93263]
MTRIVFALVWLFVALSPASSSAADRITVFAAASLKDVMDRVVSAFEAQSGAEVVVSLAGSSVLARQIDAGAPADLFISADVEWMDWLAERGKIEADTRSIVAGNELVIVTGRRDVGGEEPEALLSERFAMGDPSHVPAGHYAEAALSELGLWDAVRNHAVFGENVRVALELARRGEVGAAIVYGSDQKAVPGLARAYTFPDDSHPPIAYPAALTPEAEPQARALLDFLSSPSGQTIFAGLGFKSAAGTRP